MQVHLNKLECRGKVTQPPYCPFWLWYDAPRERGENTSKPGRQPWVPGSLCAKKGTLLSIPRLHKGGDHPMFSQGDLIQLSPSCNGRYVNPKGGSSPPRCQPLLQKLQHWTNRADNWVNCSSQTPGFKDAPHGRVQLPSSGGSGTGYGLLNLDRKNIHHGSWPCMGHTHNFQSSGWGCQILPWSWDSKSRLIGISQGDRYKRGVSSENQVWEGQNGAMRRRLLTFTLHSTAGTLLSIPRLPVCLRRPCPSLSMMRPSWSYGNSGSHPFSPRSGEKRGPAIVKGVESNCATPW